MNFAHALHAGHGYGSDACLESLRALQRLGVDSIAIMPFGFQRSPTDTEIIWVGNRGRGISESDARMRAVTAHAHQLGMRVLMKPHLWLRPPDWPGSIRHESEKDWQAWFQSYEAFILHYARLAEELKIESLSVGNELQETSGRDADWRRIIAGVRQIYHGRLTYGANFREVLTVPFWDALDEIGVSAYYPLATERSPSRNALIRAWAPIAAQLGELSRKVDRPVVFTELGYRSSDSAAIEPWEHSGGDSDLRLQADAYAAFFQAVWPQPWLRGVYVWKWESYTDHGSPQDRDFTIEHKPAEEIVKRNFKKSARRAARVAVSR